MLVGGGVAYCSPAVALVLSAFQQNLVFFHTPTEIVRGQAPTGKTFRIGGMVEDGSIARGRRYHRALCDHRHRQGHPGDLQGTPPTCSRRGKGAVVQGKLEGGVFHATEVLAKARRELHAAGVAHAVEQAQKAAQTVSQ